MTAPQWPNMTFHLTQFSVFGIRESNRVPALFYRQGRPKILKYLHIKINLTVDQFIFDQALLNFAGHQDW